MTNVRTGKLLITILILTSTLLVGIPLLPKPVQAETTLPSNMPVIFVDPQNKTATPGDTITISVRIFNLTNTVYLGRSSLPTPDTWAWGEPLPPDGGGRYNYSLGNLFAFEIQFSWNPLILDYVNHTVKVPVETYPDGVLYYPVMLVNDTIDDETGASTIAYSSMGLTTPVFNCPDNNATFFEMTFNVVKFGKSHLNITWSDLAVPFLPGYMDFFYAIPHAVVNGQFQTEVLATSISDLEIRPFDNGQTFEPPIISGESARISTTLINHGSMTDTYSFNLSKGTTLLRTWENETLEAGDEITYNYTIDESELPMGNHTITGSIFVQHGGFNFTDETIKQFKIIGPPQLNIIGPDSATAGDHIEYSTTSNHTDPNGEILLYTWELWRPPETQLRESIKGEIGSFDLDPRYVGGNWTVKLVVLDNYGLEYNEDRPKTAAYLTTKTLALQALGAPSLFSIENIILMVMLIIVIAGAVVYLRRRSR